MDEAPSLPPLLTGRPAAHPWTAAIAGAAEGRLGAGDLLWLDADRLAAVAIVLEPDIPLREAAWVLLAAAVAAGDALAALLPPERPVSFAWPDRVRVDGAEIGRVRARAGPLDERGAPLWLVVGLEIRLAHDGPDPGRTPAITSLEEEGGGDVGAVRLIESFSRHFVFRLHIWETEGARPIAEAWTALAEGRGETVAIGSCRGRFLGLDEHGDALLESEGRMRALSLVEAVDRTHA